MKFLIETIYKAFVNFLIELIYNKINMKMGGVGQSSPLNWNNAVLNGISTIVRDKFSSKIYSGEIFCYDNFKIESEVSSKSIQNFIIKISLQRSRMFVRC